MGASIGAVNGAIAQGAEEKCFELWENVLQVFRLDDEKLQNFSTESTTETVFYLPKVIKDVRFNRDPHRQSKATLARAYRRGRSGVTNGLQFVTVSLTDRMPMKSLRAIPTACWVIILWQRLLC